MLFAMWRRGPTRPGLVATITAWLRQHAPSRADLGQALVAVGGLSQLVEEANGWVAYDYRGAPVRVGDDPPGAQARLTARGFTVTAGPLPHFPVYYHRAADDSLLVVCSELLPILDLLPPGRIDELRLVELAAWQPGADRGSTVFRHVRRLSPCEWLLAGDNRIDVRTRIPSAGTEYLRDHPRDLAVGVRERLDQSIEKAIAGSRRIAVFAGGGVDSSGVLALAVARCRKAGAVELEALAEVWSAPGDDGPHLATLERALGIVATRLPARAAARWLEPSLCPDGQPQSFPAACLDMLLWHEAAQRNVGIALAGHAGDEITGGPLWFPLQSARGNPLRVVTTALRLRTPWPCTPSQRIAQRVLGPTLRPYLPGALRRRHLRRAYARPWMRPRFLELLDQSFDAREPLLPSTPDEWMKHFCTRPYFGELAVSWGQIHSVTPAPVVDVFRDLEFVKFISRIDPLDRHYGCAFRGLYGLALQGLVPDSVRLRRDKAMGQPAVAEAIVHSQAEELLIDLSSLKRLAARELVEPSAFKPVFDAWLRCVRRGERAGRDPADESWHTVWQLLSVEAFLRKVERTRYVA